MRLLNTYAAGRAADPGADYPDPISEKKSGSDARRPDKVCECAWSTEIKINRVVSGFDK